MWDGSTVPLKENLDIAEELLDKSQKAHTVLEIEIGAVGGEEDGHSAEINEKLYSTPEDGLEVARRLGLGERGRYMAAFTFGNVHGAYKPAWSSCVRRYSATFRRVWRARCRRRVA